MSAHIGLALLAVALVIVFRLLNATDVPKIKNLPEIPGVPVLGNLAQLGTNHARVAQKWASKYGPVFQTRLGNKVSLSASYLSVRGVANQGDQRVIFVNSYESVRYFWVTHQSSLISRPTFHTFHSVISSSQGFTIGTSPWDASCKNRRKAAATALNRPSVQSYMPILDFESMASIRELLDDSRSGTVDIDPNAYFTRYALNTSLTLNYGSRIEGTVDNELLEEISYVERAISKFRSTSNNWQDYVPMLRLFAGGNTKAEDLRLRRDNYLSDLLNNLKREIANGTDKPCITGNILKDPEAVLNQGRLVPTHHPLYTHNN